MNNEVFTVDNFEITKKDLPKYKIVGVVGPSCGGKNLASSLLEKRGYKTIDADLIAHKVLDKKQKEVIDTFMLDGKKQNIEITNKNGSLNKTNLGKLLFTNPKLLEKHENILYPEITKQIEKIIEASKSPVAINAALLHKTSLIEKCDLVLYIDALYLIRFFRALKRDKIPILRIIERFSAQKKLFSQYLLKKADTLRVDNNRSIKALEKKLDKVL